jgi:uncharacterized membrane protein YfcA
LTLGQWLLAGLAAVGIGVSKSGLPGVSLLHVVIMASLFGPRESTGVILPMLVVGDVTAVALFRRHSRWNLLVRTLPAATGGVILGWGVMAAFPHWQSGKTIGAIVLGLAAMQFLRDWKPVWFERVPQSIAIGAGFGLLAGATTMIANAAGPVMGLYLLTVGLPKREFVGTSAWFFLIINLLKVPFSLQLGLITSHSLQLNALLAPLIIGGLFLGREVVARLRQRTFDSLVLIFAVVGALKLLGVFEAFS